MRSRPLIGIKLMEQTAYKTGMMNSKDDSLYEPSVTFGQATKLPKLNFGAQLLNSSTYSSSVKHRH